MTRLVKMRIVFWLIFLAGGALAGVFTDIWLRGIYFKGFLFHATSFLLGIVLLNFVMRSSKHTGRILAKHGRKGNIPRMETNRLVKVDVYGCMRHPMHLGLLFFPLSLALIIGSISFVLFYAPLEMIIMVMMIKFLEEKEALKKFGDEYRKYMSEVPFFNLSLRCLKMLISPIEKNDKSR